MTLPSRPGSGEPDVGQILLDSAKHDAPCPRSLHKARAAVLLAAATAATSTTVATAASGTVIRWTLVLKWLGVGVAGGLTTIAAIRHVGRDLPVASVPSRASASSAVVAMIAPMPCTTVPPAESIRSNPSPPVAVVPTGRLAPPVRSSEELAPAQSAQPDPSASVASPSAVASAVPTLAQEVAVLDEARRAVAGARGAEAMAVLDRYQRDFPRGRLGHEAALVRMQALIQQGNHAAAAQLAEQFLKANPNSPLAPRVRALTNR